MKSETRALIALYIDDGGVNCANDRSAAAALSKHFGAEHYEERLDLRVWRQAAAARAATGPYALDVPLAARDLMFASLGAAYCDAYGVPALAVAWRSKPRAVRVLERALNRNSRLKIEDDVTLRVFAPFAGMSAKGVVRVAVGLGAPLELIASAPN